MEDRLRLLGHFALGTLVPLTGVLLPLVLVAAPVLGIAGRWGGAGLAVLGGLLLGSTGYGLYLGFQSWPDPRGRRVTEAEAPQLRTWLEGSRRSWGGPKAQSVILDPNGWAQDLLATPSLGLLGWARFHWMIGVYPLLALSTREWEALLAWEVVWWSNQQSWLNLQVKRLVVCWQLLYSQLWADGLGWRRWAAGFLRPYSRWMTRRLEGFLIRECLWTDALIARQHGAATFSRGLCRLAVMRAVVDRRFFPELEVRLLAGEPVPDDLYGYLAEVLGRFPKGLEGALELALDGLEPQAPPLLKVRLEKLGVTPSVPLPPAQPAYRHLLEGTAVLRELQDKLRNQILNHMDQRAQRRREADRRFLALGPRMPGWFPNHPQAMEYLNLAFDRTSPETFWKLLEVTRAAHPRHPDIPLLKLRWCLRHGSIETAQTLVTGLLTQNPFMAGPCYRIMAQHFRDRGELVEAEPYWDLALRAEAVLARARRERGSATLADPLEPHGCAGPQVAEMVNYLQSLDSLGEAFLVRKKLTVHPEHPVLLLVVKPRASWWGQKRGDIQARIAREFPFPGRSTGFVLVVRPGLLWRYRSLFEGLDATLRIRNSGVAN
jgi:hypothetical protein